MPLCEYCSPSPSLTKCCPVKSNEETCESMLSECEKFNCNLELNISFLSNNTETYIPCYHWYHNYYNLFKIFQTHDLRLWAAWLRYNVGEGVQDLYAHHCWRGNWLQKNPFNSFFLQYKIGQLYMIAKHSAEQSQKGEGVEVVENRPHSDPVRFLRARQFWFFLLLGSRRWSIHREENLYLKVMLEAHNYLKSSYNVCF